MIKKQHRETDKQKKDASGMGFTMAFPAPPPPPPQVSDVVCRGDLAGLLRNDLVASREQVITHYGLTFDVRGSGVGCHELTSTL